MRLLITIFSISVLLTACTNSKNIDLKSKDNATYSYIIGNINNEKIIDQKNPNIVPTIASCHKNITALLALEELGPEYKFETSLYKTKNKDLVIKFRGDPNLRSENLFALLEPFRNSNFKKNILVDISEYKVLHHSNNIMLDDIGTKYAQPVSAAIIDKNQINIKINSNVKTDKPIIENDGGIVIINNLKNSLDSTNIKYKWLNNKEIVFEGEIIENTIEYYKISPKNIEPFLISKLTKILNQLNIKYASIKIITDFDKSPKDLIWQNSIFSNNLKDILPKAMKISDNLALDSIYLTILHNQLAEQTADWHQGDKVYKDLIKKHFGLNVNDAYFVDGSGLSRYNRIKLKDFYNILKIGFQNQDFTSSLGKSQDVDSTFTKRFFSKNIIAKTGFLSGTSCLSGYILNEKQPKVFVIVANNFGESKSIINNAIDEFIDQYSQ